MRFSRYDRAVSVLPPVAELNVRRLLHELFYRERWPRGKTLARLLLEGLDDAAGVTGDESALDGPRGEQFAAMVRRVARDFESHPLRDQFIQLLQDERELLDEQIPPLVEYLYSSVVNNFKGEIAELVVRSVIHRYSSRPLLSPLGGESPLHGSRKGRAFQYALA